MAYMIYGIWLTHIVVMQWQYSRPPGSAEKIENDIFDFYELSVFVLGHWTGNFLKVMNLWLFVISCVIMAVFLIHHDYSADSSSFALYYRLVFAPRLFTKKFILREFDFEKNVYI